MHADLPVHEQRAWMPALLTPVQAFGAVTAVIVIVFALFAPTTASMVQTWWRSETFTHGFLVIPAVLGFAWLRREELARLPIRPWPLGLLWLVVAGAVWLLGQLSSSLAPAQLAVVSMVPAALASLLGWRWVKTLAFPLAFLFFAVPFGEIMVPTLIEWTADFTVAAVAASGVPVYREANNFVIPSGRWSVVEACSGIRYLISSVMLGSLYAWIMYRSPLKRTGFILAAIAVPLVANWLRAYGIVMLGHLSNNRIATGVDHVIYGWLFFGVLMLAMFWIGARWRDDHPSSTPARWDSGSLPAARRSAPLAVHAGLVLAALAAWPLAHAALITGVDARPVTDIAVRGAAGWTAADPAPVAGWQPDLHGPVHAQLLSYVKEGRTISVYLVWYRNQHQGAELVSSMNQLVHQDNERWRLVDRRRVSLADEGGSYDANAALIRGGGATLAAAQWYWLAPDRTVSDTKAKLALAMDRLLRRSDTSAWVVIATPARESLRDGLPVLASFVRDMGPALNQAMMEMAQ